MGISGLGWERGRNLMGAALGNRGEGTLGTEVVARWDAGVHYFVQARLYEMRHGRGTENGARVWPGVHPWNCCKGKSWWSWYWCRLWSTIGTLGYEAGMLKGLCTA